MSPAPAHEVDLDLPDEAWLLALADLPEMTPARLCAVLSGGSARAAFTEVRDGDVRRSPAARLVDAGVARRWAAAAGRVDLAGRWREHMAAGVGVAGRGSVLYPSCFVDDPHPPALVTWVGEIGALHGPRVALVGTRDCSRHGYELARRLGHDLAASGVRVVSGLALGIDGAAHVGALEAGAAPPVAVVAGGVDVVYPRRNARLWREVAERGALCSEHPLGAAIQPWQFLARNRLIAAMADVVVVVESHSHGGALTTAQEGLRRGRTVMAAPGPVGAPAAAGVNDLLADGAGVCRGADDILLALQLDSAVQARAAEVRAAPDLAGQELLDAMGWQPVAIEQLMVLTGRDLARLAADLDRLEEQGWVAMRGGWYERVGTQATPPRTRRRRR